MLSCVDFVIFLIDILDFITHITCMDDIKTHVLVFFKICFLSLISNYCYVTLSILADRAHPANLPDEKTLKLKTHA